MPLSLSMSIPRRSCCLRGQGEPPYKDWQISTFLSFLSHHYGLRPEHCRQEDHSGSQGPRLWPPFHWALSNVDSGQPALHSPRDRLRPRVHGRRGPPVVPLDGGACTLGHGPSAPARPSARSLCRRDQAPRMACGGPRPRCRRGGACALHLLLLAGGQVPR